MDINSSTTNSDSDDSVKLGIVIFITINQVSTSTYIREAVQVTRH